MFVLNKVAGFEGLGGRPLLKLPLSSPPPWRHKYKSKHNSKIPTWTWLLPQYAKAFWSICVLLLKNGRIQNMDPQAMDHPCGPSPRTPLWTQSMDYPCGPSLIFKDEFYQRSKQLLGNLNEQNRGQSLLSGLWAPHILDLFKFCLQFHTNAMGSF